MVLSELRSLQELRYYNFPVNDKELLDKAMEDVVAFAEVAYQKHDWDLLQSMLSDHCPDVEDYER